MTRRRIELRDVQIGDVVHYMGHPHLIERVTATPSGPVAHAADGWKITLVAGGYVDVDRSAVTP